MSATARRLCSSASQMMARTDREEVAMSYFRTVSRALHRILSKFLESCTIAETAATASETRVVLMSRELNPSVAYSSDPDPIGKTGTTPAAMASRPVRPNACHRDMSTNTSLSANSAATPSRSSVPRCSRKMAVTSSRHEGSTAVDSSKCRSSACEQPNVSTTTLVAPKGRFRSLRLRKTCSVPKGLRRGVDGRTMATTRTDRASPNAASGRGGAEADCAAAPMAKASVDGCMRKCASRAPAKAERSMLPRMAWTVTLCASSTLLRSQCVLAKRSAPGILVYEFTAFAYSSGVRLSKSAS
mmetsp:Transcript_7941/g.25985  ORF Transcript_7941/g.25985 Transcript_7941/m.25985 type:complete len:300 (-) Transcript_7941:2202-3101(-)